MLEQPVKNRNQEENLGESKISTCVGIELYRCSVLVLVPLVLVLRVRDILIGAAWGGAIFPRPSSERGVERPIVDTSSSEVCRVD